uniref:Uncharacterized protein n=1 Tax=Onchocerca volvulus TaxID=6282 RepID=A0A8R1XY57_ONCVO
MVPISVLYLLDENKISVNSTDQATQSSPPQINPYIPTTSASSTDQFLQHHISDKSIPIQNQGGFNGNPENHYYYFLYLSLLSDGFIYEFLISIDKIFIKNIKF